MVCQRIKNCCPVNFQRIKDSIPSVFKRAPVGGPLYPRHIVPLADSATLPYMKIVAGVVGVVAGAALGGAGLMVLQGASCMLGYSVSMLCVSFGTIGVMASILHVSNTVIKYLDKKKEPAQLHRQEVLKNEQAMKAMPEKTFKDEFTKLTGYQFDDIYQGDNKTFIENTTKQTMQKSVAPLLAYFQCIKQRLSEGEATIERLYDRYGSSLGEHEVSALFEQDYPIVRDYLYSKLKVAQTLVFLKYPQLSKQTGIDKVFSLDVSLPSSLRNMHLFDSNLIFFIRKNHVEIKGDVIPAYAYLTAQQIAKAPCDNLVEYLAASIRGEERVLHIEQEHPADDPTRYSAPNSPNGSECQEEDDPMPSSTPSSSREAQEEPRSVHSPSESASSPGDADSETSSSSVLASDSVSEPDTVVIGSPHDPLVGFDSDNEQAGQFGY